MDRMIIVIVAFFALVVISCAEEDVKTKPADLTKEEIYNINTDMYCQTDLVIKEKLLDLENPVNLYTSIVGDDIKDIDCDAILKLYVTRVHKRLQKDFKAKGASDKSLGCFMKRVTELGYDQLRFKFNSLYGIEIEKDKKDKLRTDIDKQIGDIIELSVDECFTFESPNSAKVTSSASDANVSS